jgi:23S rRNA maturation mini-RNase III
MIQNSTMESDTLRLHDRLQKTVDEKQQAKALQNVYYTSLRQLEEENLKLREHVRL